MTIALESLPHRAMFDSTVLIPALRRRAGDESFAELFDAMVDARREILIAAPSLAELLRGDANAAIPRSKFVQVVPFDQRAAALLGVNFPAHTLQKVKDEGGRRYQYYKYDALIVATAHRHGADALFTTDHGQTNLAKHVGLSTPSVSDTTSGQLPMSLGGERPNVNSLSD